MPCRSEQTRDENSDYFFFPIQLDPPLESNRPYAVPHYSFPWWFIWSTSTTPVRSTWWWRRGTQYDDDSCCWSFICSCQHIIQCWIGVIIKSNWYIYIGSLGETILCAMCVFYGDVSGWWAHCTFINSVSTFACFTIQSAIHRVKYYNAKRRHMYMCVWSTGSTIINYKDKKPTARRAGLL